MVINDFPSLAVEDTLSPALLPSHLLARQPILDGRCEVFAYELLFPGGWQSSFHERSGSPTPGESLAEGIESLTGNRPAFIQCTREALVAKQVTLLPPTTAVLEIAASIEPDAELVQACAELRAMGYRFALDDFLPRPEMQPLIDLASYIKVDFKRADAKTRQQIGRMARGKSASLMGVNVEDHIEFSMARTDGYKFFKGYFFCRPKVVANRPIAPSRMNYLRLLMELARTPINLGEIMRIVQSDPALCYRLLLLANSPLWGIRGDISSPRHAFMLIGEERFRTLVSVATSCSLAQGQPPALIALSLERARFCEQMAVHTGQNPTEQFMLGLLSLLDAMLDTAMQSVLKSLPLREEAKAVLMGLSNAASVPLSLIRSFESGALETCKKVARELGMGEEKMAGVYTESLRWAGASLVACR